MPLWETVVVVIVVGAAVAWGGRAVWRAARGGKVCSDCIDAGSCPSAGRPELQKLQELKDRDRE